MKSAILLAAMLLSTSLFAHGRTILKTSYTTVLLAYNIPMNQVCIDGDEMRTKDLKKVCTKYRRIGNRDRDRRECVKHEYKYFSKPLQFEKKVCVKTRRRGRDRDDVCVKWEMKTINLPLEYTKTVTKHRWQGSRSDGDWSMFGKLISKEVFPVPYCN